VLIGTTRFRCAASLAKRWSSATAFPSTSWACPATGSRSSSTPQTRSASSGPNLAVHALREGAETLLHGQEAVCWQPDVAASSSQARRCDSRSRKVGSSLMGCSSAGRGDLESCGGCRRGCASDPALPKMFWDGLTITAGVRPFHGKEGHRGEELSLATINDEENRRLRYLQAECTL